jgi:hypothetical protein
MASVSIGRLSLDITAPGTRDAAALKDRLCAQVRRDLARGLSLGSARQDDRSLIHIRRLKVDLTAIGEVAPERIGLELGRRLGRAVDRLIELPDAQIVAFASPAARLAAFVTALANGDPVDRWWFAAFAGLAPLARPRAITTALERDLEDTREAFQLLAEPARRALPACLGEAEARRFLAAVIDPLAPGAAACVGHLAGQAQAQAMPGEDAASLALALLLEAARSHDLEGALGALAAAANLVAGVVAAGARRAPANRRGPARQGLSGDLSAAPLPEAARALAAGLDPATLGALDAIRTGRRRETNPVGAAPDTEARYTPFANAALLWPFVDALPLDRLHRGAAPKGCDPDRLAAFLLLAVSQGPDRAAAFWRDPVWRDLLAIPAATTLEAVRRALRAAPPAGRIRADGPGRRSSRAEVRWLSEAATTLVGKSLASRLVGPARVAIGQFAGRLPGFAASSAPYLAQNVWHGGGSVRLLPERIEIEVARPPLDILLAMTRLADREARLADGRLLVLRRGGGA